MTTLDVDGDFQKLWSFLHESPPTSARSSAEAEASRRPFDDDPSSLYAVRGRRVELTTRAVTDVETDNAIRTGQFGEIIDANFGLFLIRLDVPTKFKEVALRRSEFFFVDDARPVSRSEWTDRFPLDDTGTARSLCALCKQILPVTAFTVAGKSLAPHQRLCSTCYLPRPRGRRRLNLQVEEDKVLHNLLSENSLRNLLRDPRVTQRAPVRRGTLIGRRVLLVPNDSLRNKYDMGGERGTVVGSGGTYDAYTVHVDHKGSLPKKANQIEVLPLSEYENDSQESFGTSMMS